MIKILVIEPRTAPYVKEIGKELKDFQSIVGGYIETIALTNNAILVCNEEGKIKNLRPNRILTASHTCNLKDKKENRVIDTLYGTFFILGLNDELELTSISNDQIKYWTKEFDRECLYL